MTTAADITQMGPSPGLVVVTERERLDGRTLVRGVCTPSVSDAELLERADVGYGTAPPKVERSEMRAATGGRTIRHLEAFVVIVYGRGTP